jgi:hypothetical protein
VVSPKEVPDDLEALRQHRLQKPPQVIPAVLAEKPLLLAETPLMLPTESLLSPHP